MHSVNTYSFHHIVKDHKHTNRLFYVLKKSSIVLSIYFLFGLLFQHVYANTKNSDNIDPYQAQHGSVWLLANNDENNGVYLEALQMQTDVDFKITGPIVRAKIKQTFKNTGVFWAEGIYVFPLPENAAVDTFKMIIGERHIEGQIKENVIAKRTYEKAKRAGKKASLIAQQRPNIFTTSLANIAPGEEITIEFTYQQVLSLRDNRYRLRYPMVIGPRYNVSTNTDNSTDKTQSTHINTQTDSKSNSNNLTRIHILLDAGVSLSQLESSYHKIHINQTSETRYSISTTGENIIANRDFELVWQPQRDDNPVISIFNETPHNDDSYTLLSLLPPALNYLEQKIHARDIVFVLDVSGSMAGTSIQQAKAALSSALDNLRSIDSFNIIWFNHLSEKLFPTTVTATSHNKDYAKQFIRQLHADGGTEMLAALKLSLPDQQAFSRLRQIVFITDGNINNESELFQLITKNIGNSRLFTIGIGSAPNSYFMQRAAEQGRGTFTYIGNINDVHEKTTQLFKKLENPALINIQLRINNDTDTNDQYEIFPKNIPDLYANEPLTILIKGKKTPETMTIKGDYGNSEWQTNVTLTSTDSAGIRIAWAREKIKSLMNQHREANNNVEREQIKQTLTKTALRHSLVSQYTSLVAVDVTPTNTEGLLYQEQIKNNLPHGWKINTSSRSLLLAQTATDSTLNLLIAITFFIMAAILFSLRKTTYKQHSL
ncbi:MAG: marine proteobacterial sortase target protein [Gammaproteobacteria bacterium]|nr:marine proteobacterial sortase target protein [Gammaproteobacteria bacterium]